MTAIPETVLTGGATPALATLAQVLPCHPSATAGTVAFQAVLSAAGAAGAEAPLPFFGDAPSPLPSEKAFASGGSGRGVIASRLLDDSGSATAPDPSEPENPPEPAVEEPVAASILPPPIPEISVASASQVGNTGENRDDLGDLAPDKPANPPAPLATALVPAKGALAPTPPPVSDVPNPGVGAPPLPLNPQPPQRTEMAPSPEGDEPLAGSSGAVSSTQAVLPFSGRFVQGAAVSTQPDMPPVELALQAPGADAPLSTSSERLSGGLDRALPPGDPATSPPRPAPGPVAQAGTVPSPPMAVAMPSQPAAQRAAPVLANAPDLRLASIPETDPAFGTKAVGVTPLVDRPTGTPTMALASPVVATVVAPSVERLSEPLAEAGREPDPPPIAAPPAHSKETGPTSLGMAMPIPAVGAVPMPQADATRPPGEAGLAPPAVQDVGRQINSLLRDPGTGTIALRLNPKELGSVTITLQPVVEGVVIRVQAERPETADLMRRHTDLLLQEMRHAGFAQAAVHVPTVAADSSPSQTTSLMSGQGGGLAGGSGGGDQSAPQGPPRAQSPAPAPAAAPDRAATLAAGVPTASGRLNLRL